MVLYHLGVLHFQGLFASSLRNRGKASGDKSHAQSKIQKCKTGGKSLLSKRYNTPHRDRIIKTRVTEEEHADFMERLTAYGMSQSEFIRQAITGATVKPIITVSPVNDELLAAVGRLTGECGKIGGNLNQIARYLNEYGTPYTTLAAEVRAELSDLAALRFQVLREVGEAIGNTETFKL
ncbi:MAG: plasmid mobilization relaxosome protein MobC [Dysosmobacter sp.]|nr:plasmid mobilization relaxosome protein MobC [Dysosmobacter sp.]